MMHFGQDLLSFLDISCSLPSDFFVQLLVISLASRSMDGNCREAVSETSSNSANERSIK